MLGWESSLSLGCGYRGKNIVVAPTFSQWLQLSLILRGRQDSDDMLCRLLGLKDETCGPSRGWSYFHVLGTWPDYAHKSGGCDFP